VKLTAVSGVFTLGLREFKPKAERQVE